MDRTVVASMKREYFETGIAVMQVLSNALCTKEKCRIVVEYDPAQDVLNVYKEVSESPFRTPAQWTGELIGKMHNHSVTCKALAKEVGWHEKYLSQVLNSDMPPKSAEAKLNAAFDRIVSGDQDERGIERDG